MYVFDAVPSFIMSSSGLEQTSLEGTRSAWHTAFLSCASRCRGVPEQTSLGRLSAHAVDVASFVAHSSSRKTYRCLSFPPRGGVLLEMPADADDFASSFGLEQTSLEGSHPSDFLLA